MRNLQFLCLISIISISTFFLAQDIYAIFKVNKHASFHRESFFPNPAFAAYKKPKSNKPNHKKCLLIKKSIAISHFSCSDESNKIWNDTANCSITYNEIRAASRISWTKQTVMCNSNISCDWRLSNQHVKQVLYKCSCQCSSY